MAEAGLVRTIGRWTLVGLVLNGILGSGVFGLPSVIAAKVGAAAWWAWPLAALPVGAIMACFAEVASRFGGAGGPYLYARVAFGSFVGIQMGWLAYLVRLTAAAANANLLVIYFAEFWPTAATRWAGALVILVVLGGLAVVNYRGVRQGARMSNLFIVSKLVPLLLFGLVGLALIGLRGAVAPAGALAPLTTGTWIETLLLLVFAYGGFEAALVPLAEARAPQRDAPFALFVALAAVTAIYTLVQVVVSLSLVDAPTHARPLAAAARALAGPAAATFITVGALLSVYGYLAGALVNSPRLTYAMAEQGDFPSLFARVHPVFRTPHVSVVAFALLTGALALSGSFVQNITLSVVSRLATYGLVCLAVPVLRRRPDVPPPAFRLPAGIVFAGIGILCSLVLVTRMTLREGAILGVVMAAAGLNWRLAPAQRSRTAA